MSNQSPTFRIIDLGRLAYEPALAEQRRAHQAVLDGDQPHTLLLVEHDPVITLTPRPCAAGHLVAGEQLLAQKGVRLCPTDRGGDITYHGPGQIVAYPIIRLNDLKLNVRQYVRTLETAIIDTLAEFGIQAHRDPAAPGVWVGGNGELGLRIADRGAGNCQMKSTTSPQSSTTSPQPPALSNQPPATNPQSPATNPQQPTINHTSAKVAAIGVRVKRWVTLHGLALNVCPDMSHFDLIVPCGLHGRAVTCMADLLGDRCPPIDRVRTRLAHRLQDHLTNR